MTISKEISKMEMVEYVIMRMLEMKVSGHVFLESGTVGKLEKTYYYLKQHDNVTEAQLVRDLNYTSKR